MMKILTTKGPLNFGRRWVWICSFVCEEQSGVCGAPQGWQRCAASGYLELWHLRS